MINRLVFSPKILFKLPTKKINLNVLLLSAYILLILLKLYLTSGQSIYAVTFAGHDDRLFLNLATHIINNEWLGPYDNLTLAKGAFYPIFIAFSFKLGLPLLLSQNLAYIFASILFVLAIKPAIKNNYLLIITFAFILFNPITFTNPTTIRVLREVIYMPLTLLLVSSSIGLLLRKEHSYKTKVLWSTFTGIILSMFWHTREEGIWILPFVGTILSYYMLVKSWNLKKQIKAISKEFLIVICPLVILQSSILFLSLVNNYHYGVFSTVEFKNNQFVDAYSALQRIKPDVYKSRIPVTIETRKTLYELSPTFKELEQYLDNESGNKWNDYSNSQDIKGGAFMWALRDAVSSAGYYVDGNSSNEYYERLASEINELCDLKKLECINKRVSMTPPFISEYRTPFIQNFIEANKLIVNFRALSPESPSNSIGNPELKVLFEDITRSSILPLEEEFRNPNQDIYNQSKLGMLLNVRTLYGYLVYPLILLTVLSILVLLFKGKGIGLRYDIIIISLGLLFSLMTRLALVSYIEVTSFGGLNYNYLSAGFIILIPLLILPVITVINKYAKNTKRFILHK